MLSNTGETGPLAIPKARIGLHVKLSCIHGVPLVFSAKKYDSNSSRAPEAYLWNIFLEGGENINGTIIYGYTVCNYKFESGT